MKVTALYSSIISALIQEYGYTWQDVNAIQDNENRVKYGDNNQFSSSLEHMFYVSRMHGWDNYSLKQNIIDAFIKALEETRQTEEQTTETTNTTIMNTLFNAGSEYEILDRGGNNLLLRRLNDNQYVIAHGWRGEGKGWDAGKYFGDNEQSARETFEQYKSLGSYGYN